MRPEHGSTTRARSILAAVLLAGLDAGCAATLPRDIVPETLVDEAQLTGMTGIRIWGDASEESLRKLVRAEAPKMRALMASHQHQGQVPVINIAAISGGADDGAFGAGLLVGWSDAGARPDFDLVTGVSAGALIAPFVFLGREKDPELGEIFTKYTQQDIFTQNVVSGLFGGSALADSSPLARLIARYVDRQFLREVARERMNGRILLIGTTNLDAQRPVLWDMGRIAMSDSPEALSLFRKVLLASASIPGVFPPVRIQVRADGRTYDELHADGGVTQQVFVAPPALSLSGADLSAKAMTRRVFIIRNGKISPEWQPIEANTLSITGRSISTLIKNEGLGDLYRIYATAERDHMDFNLAAIPADFKMKSPEPFDQKYMRTLYQVGYRAGRGGYTWMKTPPGLEAEARHGTPNRKASDLAVSANN
ncbi:patatin-like phospholipase family protein [Hyphomicrobium sp. DY-1]|uniref:patatin-like phospholipase family protein n=1 Tax=Hyphomicrobium sp. DY-1 TaxID=3075650 RepID=UPI0039C41DAB